MGREKWLKQTKADITAPAQTQKKPIKEQKATMASQADKYDCYHQSVQSPKHEISTLLQFYRLLSQRERQGRSLSCPSPPPDASDSDEEMPHEPMVFREDFCGTAVLCREWLARGPLKKAIGIDLDESVLEYSRQHIFPYDPDVCDSARGRMTLLRANVLNVDPDQVPRADLICALNYGLFFFRARSLLVTYLRNCAQSLRRGGIFVADLFGGAQCYSAGKHTQRTYPDFIYHFEQRYFDIMTNNAKGALHFQFKDGSWLKNAFSYDFRIYTPLEIREAMEEAGFAETHVWWADTSQEQNGLESEGDGLFAYEKIEDGTRLAGVANWNGKPRRPVHSY